MRSGKTYGPDYHLVDKNALSEQERETAPGLSERDPTDLLMMKERMSRAIHLTDDDENDDGNHNGLDHGRCDNDENGNELSSARGCPHISSKAWETEPEEDGAG